MTFIPKMRTNSIDFCDSEMFVKGWQAKNTYISHTNTHKSRSLQFLIQNGGSMFLFFYCVCWWDEVNLNKNRCMIKFYDKSFLEYIRNRVDATTVCVILVEWIVFYCCCEVTRTCTHVQNTQRTQLIHSKNVTEFICQLSNAITKQK